jgi:hypothetical protein
MQPWTANVLGLFLFAIVIGWLAVALLWRVGLWSIHPAETLTVDQGLRIGTQAPEIACHIGANDMHLSFRDRVSFVVFGAEECEPCRELIRAAAVHPATRSMRLVYVGDSESLDDIEPELARRWESYRFHDEPTARRQWRAPVSPYFHVIDETGRIAAKGVANASKHLDRMLALAPAGLPSWTLSTLGPGNGLGEA